MTRTAETTVKLLAFGGNDLLTTLETFAKAKKIFILSSETMPADNQNHQLIIEICQNQKITHLVFTSLGTQNPAEYPQRIAFFTVLRRLLDQSCSQVKMILITAAERQDILAAESTFDKIFYDEGRVLEEVKEFLESLKDGRNG